MLIVTYGGGRLGNQLLQFGQLIALAEEHPEFSFVNVPFWPYAASFAGTARNPLCYYSASGRRASAPWQWSARLTQALLSHAPGRWGRQLRYRLPRFLHYHFRSHAVDWLEGLAGLEPTPLGGWRLMPNPPARAAYVGANNEIDLTAPEALAALRAHPWMIVAGWPLSHWPGFERHQERIRAYLAPPPAVTNTSTQYIGALRRRYRTLVGVLMRQGDYRHWEGGRYYFTSAQYRAWIAEATRHFGPDCGVVVGCDEPQASGFLDGLDAVYATGAAGQSGHYLETLVELSQCDVIVTPPSTFSTWSAFAGAKPLVYLLDAEQGIAGSPVRSRHFLDLRAIGWGVAR